MLLLTRLAAILVLLMWVQKELMLLIAERMACQGEIWNFR